MKPTARKNCPWRATFLACKSGLWIKEVAKVLVALDIREQTVAEAIEAGAGLIIR